MQVFTTKQFAEIKQVLDNSGVLLVPTETVFGLAVKFDDERAVRRLMQIKDRGFNSGKVFPLMLSHKEDIHNFVKVNQTAQNLIDENFPGELTIILPKKNGWKNFYFDHYDQIGIRIPKHDFLLELIHLTGPLLVTSANLRDEEPIKNYAEAAKLNVDAVVQAELEPNYPSTIIEVVDDKIKIIRQGSLQIKNNI